MTPASAATKNVTSLLDDNGSGTLRSIIKGSAPGDTITFSGTGTIVLSQGPITIANNITIAGPGESVLNIQGNNGGALNITGGTVNISGLTFEGGNAFGNSGGAIATNSQLTISNCVFDANQTQGSGGAIYVVGGSLTLQGSIFESNSSTVGGGGAISFYGVPGGVQATLNATGCTFDNNFSANSGGAIDFIGQYSCCNNPIASISGIVANCTFTNNRTATNGGAIAIHNNGSSPAYMTLINSTLVKNTASSQGGGIFFDYNLLTIESNLIAGNSSPSGNDICWTKNGSLADGGSNLIGDGSTTGLTNGANHDQIGTATTPINAKVGPLANNGGPTPTVALLLGSPAIDGDYNNHVNADQRGVPRPLGTRNDIGAYEYIPGGGTTTIPPVISTITPASGPVGTTVTLTGVSFSTTSVVLFGGVPATSVAVVNNALIVATVPSGAKTGPVTVTNSNGTGTGPTFTVTSAVPKILSIAPSSGAVGSQIAITGSGLTGATAVTFNTTAATVFMPVSDSVVLATVPAGATSGTIKVTTPGGQATSPANFTVIAAPVIIAFAPKGGPAGTVVAISGTGFTNVASVTFNGVSATYKAVSSTAIVATVPAGATTGPISVIAQGGPVSSGENFVVGAPTPVITGFAPASGSAGSVVAITGSGFTGATSVAFNGTQAGKFTVQSDSVIFATVPLGASTGAIQVTTPAGPGVSASNFTVLTGTPTVTSFSPTTGPVGTLVLISGTNLASVSAVTFGGVAAKSFSAISDTLATATVPAGAKTGAITVTTAGGPATSSGSFTLTNVIPTVGGFTPASGPIGTQVAIYGTGLAGVATVSFNGTRASVITPLSDSVLLATIPNGATSGVITVATAGGPAASQKPFSVTTATPVITNFSPGQGPVGTTVVISGSGLSSSLTVSFGGASASAIVESDNLILANVPTGAKTGKLVVTTRTGTATSTGTFTVGATVMLAGLSTRSAKAGDMVLVSGLGLNQVSSIVIGGVKSTDIIHVSDRVLAVTVPNGARTGKIEALGHTGQAVGQASLKISQ